MASEWTVDTLKEFLLAELQAADLRYEQRFKAAENAVMKAENASEKRFDGVNEFRAALADQTASLMPRAEAEARIASVADKLAEYNTSARDQTDRLRADFQTALATVVTAQNLSAGRERGISLSWVVTLGVIAAIAAAADILSRIIK